MSPDYGGAESTAEEAAQSIADFKLRIQQYEKQYEPMGACQDDKHRCYVKVGSLLPGRKLCLSPAGFLFNHRLFLGVS
jgi:hypothetical protein